MLFRSATDATSYTFTSTFDLASFGITDATGSVCVASRISSRQGGGGAPKGSACLTVATHTVTGQPTPTPSGSATPTPSASTSPSPTSSVEGATAPPTDSLTGSRGSSNPALGLVLLVAMPLPFMRMMGVAGFLIPCISIVAAATLQPVLLSYYGHRGTVRVRVLRWRAAKIGRAHV